MFEAVAGSGFPGDGLFIFVNPYQIHADGLRALQNEMHSDCPALSFDGSLIRVLPGSVKFQRDNSPGGFSIDCDLRLTCLSVDFGETPPDSGDQFNYPGSDGRLFVIKGVHTAPNGLQIHIDANFASQGL